MQDKRKCKRSTGLDATVGYEQPPVQVCLFSPITTMNAQDATQAVRSVLYEQRSRNVWISRTVGGVFLATLVFVVYVFALVLFTGDLFWFALMLTLVLLCAAYGYLKSDRWVIGRFAGQFIEPPRRARAALEEMAIAAGIPTPVLYVIDTGTLNAFAVGRERNAGVVVVTKGLVEALSDEELRAVMAHEVAHIRDGDSTAGAPIALMAFVANRVATLGSGLLLLLLQLSAVSGTAGLVPIGAFMCLIMPAFARAAQMAFGRSREYLADNSAVLLMRTPEPLIGALSKLDARSTVVVRAGLATSHLFISSPRPWWNSEMISTHPPIRSRIERLRHVTAVPVTAAVP